MSDLMLKHDFKHAVFFFEKATLTRPNNKILMEDEQDEKP